MKLPNRDYRGKDDMTRRRCCSWCRSEWACIRGKKRNLIKKLAQKKLRRFVSSLNREDLSNAGL